MLDCLRSDTHRRGEAFLGFGSPVYEGTARASLPITARDGALLPPLDTESRCATEEEILPQDRDGGVERWNSTAPLAPLTHARDEVTSIAGLFSTARRSATVLLGADASAERVRRMAQSWRDVGYLHFACHGASTQDFQWLWLSVPRGASVLDGVLGMNSIAKMDFSQCRLVTFSACQTARGSLRKGEGIVGLTRAVMAGGGAAVIATLWSIDDEASAELMKRFYAFLLNGADTADALRRAKLRIRSDPSHPAWRSPFFWGAFVLYGE
jgi:CHAT domain-containing protein